jgi:hypothetical protein
MRRRLTGSPTRRVWRDFTIYEQMAFVRGWSSSDCRWRSRREFVEDYLAVRAHVCATFNRGLAVLDPAGLPFGERALRLYRDRGAHALEEASNEEIRCFRFPEGWKDDHDDEYDDE